MFNRNRLSVEDKHDFNNLKTVNTSIIEGFKSIEQFPLLEMFERIKNGQYHNRIFPIRKLVEHNRSADDLKRRLMKVTLLNVQSHIIPVEMFETINLNNLLISIH